MILFSSLPLILLFYYSFVLFYYLYLCKGSADFFSLENFLLLLSNIFSGSCFFFLAPYELYFIVLPFYVYIAFSLCLRCYSCFCFIFIFSMCFKHAFKKKKIKFLLLFFCPLFSMFLTLFMSVWRLFVVFLVFLFLFLAFLFCSHLLLFSFLLKLFFYYFFIFYLLFVLLFLFTQTAVLCLYFDFL